MKPKLAIFLQFCLRESDRHSLIIGLLWQQVKSQKDETYILDSLYIHSEV